MGVLAGTMTQPSTGLSVDVYEGWSWPCFFFGSLWHLSKGMWGIGLLWLALSIVTGSVLHWLGILYVASIANRQYLEHLGSRGYVLEPISDAQRAEDKEHAGERRMGYVMIFGIIVAIAFGMSWLAGRS